MEDFHDNEDTALYNRFKSYLRDRDSSAFFDEDDLVEVFDIAGDYDDDYVRMEVLFYGARYYPDSSDLADRRGILYQTYSDTMRDGYLNDHPELLTFISSVLRLRAVAPEPEMAYKMLDDLVDGADNLSDEEVIQLADAASALGVSQWLLDRLDLLKTKTEYPATLLYEMDVIFEMEKKPELCEKMLEELTELEPFNSEFWRLLAQVQSDMGGHEKAESSIDYALAIEPESVENILSKANILVRTDNSEKVEKAAALLEKLFEKDQSDMDVIQQLLLCYLFLERRDKAKALADKALVHHPESDWLIATMIALDPSRFGELIEAFEQSGPHPEEDWISVADMAASEHPVLGAMVMLTAATKVKFDKGWEPLFRHLYQSERYKALCDFVSNLAEDENFRANFTGEMSMLYVKSLLKLGRTGEAREYAKAWVDTFRDDGATEEEIRFEAISAYMREVLGQK